MAVYLLHFSEPIAPVTRSAQHYIGFAKGNTIEACERRLKVHKAGRGGRLPAVAAERGFEITIARVWLDGDRALEKRLKRQKMGPRLCPICQNVINLSDNPGHG